MGLMGSTREDHAGILRIHEREEFAFCLNPFVSDFIVLVDSLCIIRG